jgi:hypothetical protein
MNTSHPETKVGLLDLEINKLAKVNLLTCSLNTAHLMYQDSVHRDFCAVTTVGRAQRFPRSLVHLCFSFPHPILVHYTHQVWLSSV